jgi:hypothetical protein
VLTRRRPPPHVQSGALDQAAAMHEVSAELEVKAKGLASSMQKKLAAVIALQVWWPFAWAKA